MGDRRIMDNLITPFERLEQLYIFAKGKELDELQFEFVISALFPNVWTNVQEELRKQHALGYAEGLRSAAEDE